MDGIQARAPGVFVDARTRRVLVAEDDPEMCRVISDALGKDGFDVRTVGDGAALLVALARDDRFHFDRVDLVIADVRMPICSGLQAFDTIRAVRARVPFLMMSAFADEAMHEQVRRAGATLLAKPFTIKALRKAVLGSLTGRH